MTPEVSPRDQWPKQWLRKRKLKQFKGFSDEEFAERMRASAPTDVDAAVERATLQQIIRLELAIPEAQRPHFRKEVQRILGEIGDQANAELLRPMVENYVFIGVMARDAAVTMYKNKDYNDKDVKALDLLLSRGMQMLAEFEQTPKGMRLSNRKTQESLLSAVAASMHNVETLQRKEPVLLEEERILTESHGDA